MATTHSHVPKRAVQHGIFTPSEEISPPSLKPGQKELRPLGLYTAEVGYKGVAGQVIQDRGFETEYSEQVSKATGTEDYKNPRRPIRTDRRANAESKDSTGAAHWVSEYRQSSTEGASRMATPRMTAQEILASRQIPAPPSCISRAPETSCYGADFGRHGSDPRDKVSIMDTKLPVFKSNLTAGTPRGTAHIPGYQGFIPSHPGCNEPLQKAASGESMRSIDKTNIEQIFHKDLVGYAGHNPQAVINDFGGRKPTKLTIFGRDFQPHKTGALR
eukprot:TRINITY_DN85428_c0_g1_i1.p1 TRINITY_DN85428_c0_g1~~TRINITY_DN85428_c0_g1_i1.p1  ORF type:complete len:290 (-),score=50.44 TRINITY_DN85428_c0_g1_i1:158-976(-)